MGWKLKLILIYWIKTIGLLSHHSQLIYILLKYFTNSETAREKVSQSTVKKVSKIVTESKKVLFNL